jgi:hypothetical protein
MDDTYNRRCIGSMRRQNPGAAPRASGDKPLTRQVLKGGSNGVPAGIELCSELSLCRQEGVMRICTRFNPPPEFFSYLPGYIWPSHADSINEYSLISDLSIFKILFFVNIFPPTQDLFTYNIYQWKEKYLKPLDNPGI